MELHTNRLFSFARDVGNITGPTSVKHGYIDTRHTSNITAGWTPSTLPAPFPFVVVSSLVSFIIACVGWKTAVSTWTPPEKRRTIQRPEGYEGWTWHQRWKWSRQQVQDVQNHRLELENAHAEHIPLHAPDEIGPHDDLQPISAPITRWQASPTNKILVIIALIYNTLRAVIAIIMTLEIAITRNGTHSAVSSLFLLYLSLQTFVSNRKLPRLITLILVIDLVLVGIAFLVATWDFHTASYGDATVLRGNCPVYAYDCTSQARQWTRVGCGAVVPPIRSYANSDADDSPNPHYSDKFYPPYATAGDFNAKKNQNTLSIIESVVGGCGTFWAGPTLLATLYEAVRAFGSVESISHLLWPIPMADQFVTNKKTGKTRTRLGWNAMSFFAFLGLGGAFIVTLMSIAGHIAAETHEYTATFIDGFGPAVHTNLTYSTTSEYPYKQVNSTTYWGNATSWSDCFTVTTPTSSNGFFKEWLEHNSQVRYRLVSLL